MGSTADWRDVCFSITFSASVSQLVTLDLRTYLESVTYMRLDNSMVGRTAEERLVSLQSLPL